MQPGANPGMPTGFKAVHFQFSHHLCSRSRYSTKHGLLLWWEVRRVVRVEDSEMWGRYVDKRGTLRCACIVAQLHANFDPLRKLTIVVSQHQAINDLLHDGLIAKNDHGFVQLVAGSVCESLGARLFPVHTPFFPKA